MLLRREAELSPMVAGVVCVCIDGMLVGGLS